MTGIAYAGIGARDTPDDVLQKMRIVAQTLATKAVLRSGGARGADSAFYQGYVQAGSPDGQLEIYLPQQTFNGFVCDGKSVFGPPTKEARAIAREYHPNWPNLGCLGRDFMARNAYQVLGYDLNTPTTFIICWTKDGKVVGGTGQALRMAEDLGIPVLNFGHHSDEHISDTIMGYAGGQSE